MCLTSFPVSEIAPQFLSFQTNPCQVQCHGQGHREPWNHHISAPTPFWWHWNRRGYILLLPCVHPMRVLPASCTNSHLQEPPYSEFSILRKTDWEWTIWTWFRFSFDYTEEHKAKNVVKSDTMHYSSLSICARPLRDCVLNLNCYATPPTPVIIGNAVYINI